MGLLIDRIRWRVKRTGPIAALLAYLRQQQLADLSPEQRALLERDHVQP